MRTHFLTVLSAVVSCVFLATTALIFFSCNDSDPAPSLSISNFDPSSGIVGTTVTITGNKFSSTAADNVVKFNGVTAEVSAASETELTVTVPAAATTGKITVTVDGKTATSATDFAVPQPSITSVEPASGVVGTTVIISGTNFSSEMTDNVVKFNGTAATVSAATSTQLTVTVPAEATTGKITVKVGEGTATSASDFVVPSPTITGFSPDVATEGITVTITGANFSTASPDNNIVTFNGVQASVTAATATELTVTVPTGASTGKIEVTVGSNSVMSSTNFELCSGGPEAFLTNIEITNVGSTSYNVAFDVVNTGSEPLDLTKMGMQNYASTDNVYGGGDVAASGYGLNDGGTLNTGESYHFSFSCSVVGGTTTSHPYLVVTIYDTPTGTLGECNTDNNVAVKHF